MTLIHPITRSLLGAAVCSLCACANFAGAQGTGFTYQGRLNDGANPANGFYDLRFALYDSLSGGAQQGNGFTNAATGVSNGLFTVTLDFGNQFPGAARWLEIAARTNGSGTFITLTPRQPLTPAPYAVFAGNVGAAGIVGPIGDGQLSTNIARLNGTNQVFNGAVQFNNPGSTFHGLFTGNGAGITNVPLSAQNAYGLITWDTFAPVPPLPAGAAPDSVVIVDVNGDGKPDIVCANAGSSSLSIFINNGSGGFALASTVSVGPNPVMVIAADMNNDGKPDLVTANYGPGGTGNTLSVLTNNGSGGFALAASPIVGSGPVAVVAADFNGDGRLDLACANNSGTTVSVLVQTSTGGFSPIQSLNVGNQPVSVVVTTNFYGNTNVSLVCVLGQDAPNIRVFAGNGNGTFTLGFLGDSGNAPYFATGADLTGDGVPELVIADGSTQNLVVYNFSGSTRTTVAVPGGPNAVFTADINGDGYLDVLTANNDNTVSVLTNNGSGGLTLAFSLAVGAAPQSVAAQDLNGDGKLDLVSANFSDNSVSVLLDAPRFRGAFVGDGSGLLSLNAANLSSGTLSDARLSANVALLNAGQAFTGPNVFSNAGNSFTGNGSGLVNLNATNLTGSVPVASLTSVPAGNLTGLVSDARLSSNVALRAGGNTFTNTQTFNGAINLNSTGGFSQSSVGTFSIDAPFKGGGRFLILTNGFVGISNTAPSHLLVVGSAGSPAYCDGGTWVNGSDRNAKQGFVAINPLAVLDRVVALPISEWHYKTDADTRQHLGPMAQDFHAAFGLNGSDDTHISTVDEGGVALAAIQGLNQKLEAARSESKAKDVEIQELKQSLAELRAMVTELAQTRAKQP